MTNPVGQVLIDCYYRVSPPVAEFITEHPSLKPIVRAGLVSVVAMSTIAVNTTLAEKAAIIGLVVLVSAGHWLSGQRSGEAEVLSIPEGEIAHLPVLLPYYTMGILCCDHAALNTHAER